MPVAFFRSVLLLSALLAAWPRLARAVEYQQLPPEPPTGLTTDWLIHEPGPNRLVLYLPDYHAPAQTYYQWVRLQPNQPFPITFAALAGLSIFLDNQLVFTAPRDGSYTLDLARLAPETPLADQVLLAVWQPDGSPALASFRGGQAPAPASAGQVAREAVALPRLPGAQGENVLLGFLLVVGLLYGGLRSTYQSGLSRVFQVGELFGRGPGGDQQSFLARPTFSFLNLALLGLFGLSFGLLLTAIHLDLQTLPLLRRFLRVPESAVVARVLLYTGIIIAFVLLKYVFVALLGYIFDLQELVNRQYREFLRSVLLAGLTVPLVLLLYLSFNNSYPQVVTLLANLVIGGVLIGTVLRVANTLHQHTSLLNLHLFAYLCASEVLPLLLLLKLLVFSS